MQELSLNILDIAQNSVKAKASLVTIEINEDIHNNFLYIIISDNGCGMTKQQVEQVTDPFFTTRTTRKVGLGVPFFKMAAEMTGGSFEIQSEVGVGTKTKAIFVYDSIDRMPLGDVTSTVVSLIQCNPDIDFLYKHTFCEKSFTLDTREIKQQLEGVPLDVPEVVLFLRDYINENYREISDVIN